MQSMSRSAQNSQRSGFVSGEIVITTRTYRQPAYRLKKLDEWAAEHLRTTVLPTDLSQGKHAETGGAEDARRRS